LLPLAVMLAAFFSQKVKIDGLIFDVSTPKVLFKVRIARNKNAIT